MVHHVKDASDLETQLTEAGAKLVVIDFFATWCGPCKRIAPEIEKLSAEMNDVVFLKVDVDENEDLATKYEVTAMPTFLFLKNNKKVESFCGADLEQLKSTISKLK